MITFLGNGDGTFQSGQTFSATGGSSGLALDDIDGDGVIDIVAVSNEVTTLLGNGDGTFQSAITYATGTGSQEVTIGDLNNDGILDIATANFSSDDVSVLLGNGDGSFQSAVTYAAGNGAYDILFEDMNSDGTLDILTKNSLDNSITILLGGGDGTFESAVSYAAPGVHGYSVTSGDVNNDGVIDIVAGTAYNHNVLLGNTRVGIAPILDFSLSTQADALQALAPLSRKLDSLSAQRGVIGAFESRLASALNTLQATSENYALAESRIRDADIAFESSQLTRLNILQQAGAAVLGQANQQPDIALQLLTS